MERDEIDVDGDGSQNDSDDERDEGQVDDNSDNDEEHDDEDEEHEEEDEEEDEDEDDEGDDDDDEEEDQDDDDDDDEDDDDDDEDGAGAQKQRSPSPGFNTSHEAYIRATKARLERIRSATNATQAQSYTIDPVGAAPHSAHVHAIAISADGTNLITGGSDGHVRRYDVYASMNGKTPLTQNVRHQFVDGVMRAGVLSAWWANEESRVKTKRSGDDDVDDDDDDERLVSPVHSLAVQQDALWCLSGAESGNINLTSLRHDTGQRRHVLKKHTAAVSAMALTNDDTELISGGWDRGVHQWDLHTAQVVRSFPGHAGQISSISFRPLQRGESWSRAPSPVVSIRASAAHDEAKNGTVSPRSPSSNQATPSSKRKREIMSATPVSAAGESLRTPMQRAGTTELATPATKTPAGQARVDSVMSSVASAHLKGGASQTYGTPLEHGSVGKGQTPFTPFTPSRKAEGKNGTAGGEDDDDDGDDSSLFNGGDDAGVEDELHDALGIGRDAHKSSDIMDVTMDDGTMGGEELRPTKVEERPSKDVKAEADEEKKGDDSDGDSLFGGASADGSGADADADGEADAEGEEDAFGEADVDAEGEDDEDADGEDDDEPLAARAAVRPIMPISVHSGGINLPGGRGTPSATTQDATPTTQPVAAVNGHAASAAPSNQPKPLPKPTFGGTSAFASFDGDVAKFSNDIMLTTTLIGQVTLWDRRVPSYPGGGGLLSNGTAAHSSSTHKGVRALALPSKTPPWCMSACWNDRGDKIYVGRRNETVDEWDLRMLPDVDTMTIDDEPRPARAARRSDARFMRSLRFPAGSGPVTAVMGMPNGRHLVCASYDNVRLWNTDVDVSAGAATTAATVPFRIVAGHQGGTVSQILLDASARILFTASGDRGWLSNSTEAVILHEVRSTL